MYLNYINEGIFDMDGKYILFGAGEMGINALHFFGKKNVRFFCDNNQSVRDIEGVPVVSVNNIIDNISKDDTIVITTIKGKNIYEISEQLKNLNLKFELFENISSRFVEKDKIIYNSKNGRENFCYRADREYIIGTDKYAQAGCIGSYFWQDLWAAKRILKEPVSIHYDIGSRLDGFIAHLLASGQRVCMIDIRPLNIKIDGLDFIESDATNLEGVEDESIESISALCSLEHFGLGRYGDPIDPEACFKCFAAIKKKLKKGGNLFISVPIGEECLCFNAHRVFNVKTILKEFEGLQLVEFSTCFRNEYEENIKDFNRFDNWYDHEGDRMGLFWLKK